MEYVLKVTEIDGDRVTLTTSRGYSETLKVGDDITFELPDNVNIQEVTSQWPEESYEDLKLTAASHIRDGYVDGHADIGNEE